MEIGLLVSISIFRGSWRCSRIFTKAEDHVLQLKDLRVGQWEEPCIGLTQENSIESSVQDSLPYIP